MLGSLDEKCHSLIDEALSTVAFVLTVHVVCPDILYSPAAHGTGVLDGFKQE